MKKIIITAVLAIAPFFANAVTYQWKEYFINYDAEKKLTVKMNEMAEMGWKVQSVQRSGTSVYYVLYYKD